MSRPPTRDRRTLHARDCGDALGDFLGVAHRDERNPRLGNAGFLAGNLLKRIAKKGLVIDAELRDAGNERAYDDVGRVEPSAEPNLNDAGIGRGAGEGEELAQAVVHLEETGAEAAGPRSSNFFEQRGERNRPR